VARARQKIPIALRYRNSPPGFSGVGPGLSQKTAGHVRIRDLVRIARPPCAGTRPDGDQALVLSSARPGSVLRFGTESHPRPSGCGSVHLRGRAALLHFLELCARAVDVGRWNPEIAPGPLDGMAARTGAIAAVLAAWDATRSAVDRTDRV